jgi:predicted aspartyl protease
MGMFEVKVKLANLAAPTETEELTLLMDTGATLSWIPRNILEGLGITALSRLPFTLAGGRRLDSEVTAVLLTIDGRKGGVPVAFGEPGEEAVLGATALEALGFAADPVGKKLLPRDLLALVGRLEVALLRERVSPLPAAVAKPTVMIEDTKPRQTVVS